MGQRPGRTIDYKEWRGIPSLEVASSAAATKQGTSLPFTAPGTILRVRQLIQASFDSTVQDGDTMSTVFGLGVVSTDAFAAGAASMPDPAAEAEYPWLWYGEIMLRQIGTSDVAAWGINAMRLDVDTRAMRRMKPGQSLAWVMQHQVVAGAPIVNVYFGQGRALVGT